MQLGSVIIGAGLMGKWHADAVIHSGHRVKAVVDPDLLRARKLAESTGARIAVKTLEELPPNSGLDVAHVCSPLETHDAIAQLVLRRGCHVIVEKPLARTAEDTVSLFTLGEAVNRMIVPVHQFLFQPGVLKLSEMVQADPQALLHLNIVACTAGASRLGASGRDDVALSILPHGLSLARRITGEAVGDISWTVLRPLAGEFHCLATLNRATVSILVSTLGRPPVNTLQAVMRDRTVDVDLFHGYSISIRGGTGRTFKVLRPFLIASHTASGAALNGMRRAIRREVAYPGLRELVRRFYAAVALRGPPPISMDETLDVARARDIIGNVARHADSGVSE